MREEDTIAMVPFLWRRSRMCWRCYLSSCSVPTCSPRKEDNSRTMSLAAFQLTGTTARFVELVKETRSRAAA
jgi:hypothetical protein